MLGSALHPAWKPLACPFRSPVAAMPFSTSSARAAGGPFPKRIARRTWALFLATLLSAAAATDAAAAPDAASARAPGELLSEGRELLKQGNPLRAHDLLAEAVARSQSAEAWYLLGYSQMQLSRLDAAQASLGRAVSMNPREPAWWQALAKARLDGRKPALAAEALDRAIALDPRADYFHARALCRLAQQDAARAEADFRACVERDPRHAAALQALGRIELDRGAAETARALLARSIEADPTQVDARFRLGMACSALGREDEAAAEFREVLERVPQHVGALWNLARILRQAGKADEAGAILARFREASKLEDELKFLEEMVRLAPGDVTKRLALSDALLRSGRSDEAFAQADAARASAPGRADVWQALARALERLGRHDDAAMAMSQAARLGGVSR